MSVRSACAPSRAGANNPSANALTSGLRSRIEALSGSVWIATGADLRDIVLDAEQSFSVDRDGDLLVSALSDARIVALGALPVHAGGTRAGRTATAAGP